MKRRRSKAVPRAGAQKAQPATVGVPPPPGLSRSGRGRMRNVGRERVAEDAGERDRPEPDGRL